MFVSIIYGIIIDGSLEDTQIDELLKFIDDNKRKGSKESKGSDESNESIEYQILDFDRSHEYCIDFAPRVEFSPKALREDCTNLTFKILIGIPLARFDCRYNGIIEIPPNVPASMQQKMKDFTQARNLNCTGSPGSPTSQLYCYGDAQK